MENILNLRTAIKYETIQVEERGKIWIGNHDNLPLDFAIYEVKKRLIDGDFTNIVYVTVSGVNGCYGPNVKPSQKCIKRLLSIINGTNYHIIEQKGLDFTLENTSL